MLDVTWDVAYDLYHLKFMFSINFGRESRLVISKAAISQTFTIEDSLLKRDGTR